VEVIGQELRRFNMGNLEDLQRSFWTVFDEMLDDIRDCGYSIDEANDEYITASNEDEEVVIYQGLAGRSTRYIFRIERYEKN